MQSMNSCCDWSAETTGMRSGLYDPSNSALRVFLKRLEIIDQFVYIFAVIVVMQRDPHTGRCCDVEPDPCFLDFPVTQFPLFREREEYYSRTVFLQERTNKFHCIELMDLPKINRNNIDGCVQVTDDEAYKVTRDLARFEGTFAGISAGANVAAALKLLRTGEKGNTIALTLNDSGLKYLSTDLFA